MLDRSGFWPAAVGPLASLQGEGLSVHVLPPVPQVMVSGDLAAFCVAEALPALAGLLAQVTAPRYTLRLARNRMLAVGTGLDHAAAGWADGVATTPMTGALAVLEISGPKAMDLFARASAIDPREQSPCAALSFAGVTSVLYRFDTKLRLHLDRGLQTYMLDWIVATRMAR